MLTYFSSTLQKTAKGWLIILLFLLDSLFMGVFLPALSARREVLSPSVGSIDLLFFYTPPKVYGMVAAYGEQGRAIYRTGELTTDILYPIVYTLFLSLLISWSFQRAFAAESKLQRLNLVPIGAWFFDLLENLGIVSMLSIYPSTPAALAWVTTVFTTIKWLFAGASMLLALSGGAIVLLKKHKR